VVAFGGIRKMSEQGEQFLKIACGVAGLAAGETRKRDKLGHAE